MCEIAESATHEVPREPSHVCAPALSLHRLKVRADSLDQAGIAQLRALQPTLGIIIGEPVVSSDLRALPSSGCIQVESGVLRAAHAQEADLGTAPNAAGLVESRIVRVDGGMSGDEKAVLSSATVPIMPGDSPVVVHACAEELGQLLLGRVLERFDEGAIGWETLEGAAAKLTPLKMRAFREWARSALRQLKRVAEPRYLLKSVAAIAILALVAPARNLFRTLMRRHPVRVFTFHRVSTLCRDGMTVAPDVFRRQVRYIARTHRVLPLDACLAMARARTRLARPVAAITFDDGYRSVYTNALPIMRNEGLVGACFISTDLVGTRRRFAHDVNLPVVDLLEVMDWREVEMLRAQGWEIGGHTATHARLSQCDGRTLTRELEQPLGVLRERLGIERPPLAYPYGGRDDITASALELARAAGYSACLSDFGGENHTPTDAFAIKRIEIGGDHPTLAWKARVHGLDLGNMKRWRVSRRRVAHTGRGAPALNV